MSVSKAKSKRPASNSPPLEPTPVMNTINGLFECYHFLSPNEYSDKTLCILAFLLRKCVGEINFSDIIDEAEKRFQLKQLSNYVTLLDERRRGLCEIDASIEKCLMINRLISYMIENESQCFSLISDVLIDMRMKMADYPINQHIDYPADYRQREQDFKRRRDTLDMRRLFYYNDTELKQPPSLIYLINRTTEHLSYIVDCKMRYDSNFHEIGLREIENIFVSSFMILNQPHCGLNPVLIYERRGNVQCTAKLSVLIISLLHDFMQSHPNFIKLDDIEASLVPTSKLFKLEPSPISWKKCCLQIDANDKSRIIQYAELSQLTIQYLQKSNSRVHLGDELYKLKFSIKLSLHLREYNISRSYEFPLESLDFGIVSHNSYIPQSLTKILLSDIRRFSQRSSDEVRQISYFMLRYFCHRTGVRPNSCLKTYLEQELHKAKSARKQLQTMEDIYMDFLVPFISRVEFMVKHPVLTMFYADGLYLGICDSERAAQIMKDSTNIKSPIVGLRLNSIKVDCKTNPSGTVTSKTAKSISCAVRVDIYNDRTKHLQYRTFDTAMLAIDIKKFVCTAHTENGKHITILSHFGNQSNITNYKSFKDFDKYFHDRLNQIHKINGDYKPITDLLYNIEAENDDDEIHPHCGSPNRVLAEIFPENPQLSPPAKTFNYDSNYTIRTNPDILSNVYSAPLQCPLINENDIIQYVCSHPELFRQIFDQFKNLQVNRSATELQYYPSQQTPFSYTNGSIHNETQYSLLQTNNNQMSTYDNQMENSMLQNHEIFDENFFPESDCYNNTSAQILSPLINDDLDLLLNSS